MDAVPLRLDRRALLLAIAGSVAAASAPAGAASATNLPQEEAALLAASVRLPFEGAAGIQLARLDHAGVPLERATAGRLDLPEGAMAMRLRLAADAARQAALTAMAGHWGIPPEECRISGAWLDHPASGRGILCRVWLEVVPA